MREELDKEVHNYLGILEAHLPEDAIPALAALEGLTRVIGGLEQQSTTDVLTGLPNRLAFEQQEQTNRWRAGLVRNGVLAERRDASPPPSGWACIYVDLDRFKQVNDTMGHLRGDRLLQHVSWLLRATARRDDELYRVGGDEFVYFMPMRRQVHEEHRELLVDDIWASFDTRFRDARDKMVTAARDRIDHGAAASGDPEAEAPYLPPDVELDGGDIVALEGIGVSYGVFLSMGTYVDRRAMLDAADQAMQEQKRHGRR